jgi:hypothetical protein
MKGFHELVLLVYLVCCGLTRELQLTIRRLRLKTRPMRQRDGVRKAMSFSPTTDKAIKTALVIAQEEGRKLGRAQPDTLIVDHGQCSLTPVIRSMRMRKTITSDIDSLAFDSTGVMCGSLLNIAASIRSRSVVS